MNIFQKLADKLKGNEELPDIDDDVTTDRYLRSLRRQDRMHKEFHEKRILKKRIAQFYKDRFKEGLELKLKKPASKNLKSVVQRRPISKKVCIKAKL